jgi:hypothetical protein
MTTPVYSPSPTFDDLWTDPEAFAIKYDVDIEDAVAAVSEASWVLYELSGRTVHGQVCWIDVYSGVNGSLITLNNGPVEAVSLVEKLSTCGTESTEVTGFCLIGPYTLRISGNSPVFWGFPVCGNAVFRITYTQMSTLVPDASRAAEALAAEYLNASQGKPCKLPDRVTTVTRQGVSWTVLDPQDFLTDGLTGITVIDQWLSVARGGAWKPVRPRLVDPLRGRFVSSTRTECE